jgi:hypothetical protein
MSIVDQIARSVSWTTNSIPALLTTTRKTNGGGVLRTPLGSRRAARFGPGSQMTATCRAVFRWERSKLTTAQLPGTSSMPTSPTISTFTLDPAREAMAVHSCPTAEFVILPTSKITRLHLDRTLYKQVMTLARYQLSASQAAAPIVTRIHTLRVCRG